jgi:hypothetical protein
MGVFVKVSIGIFVAIFAAWKIGNLDRDLARYNAMRAMSGEGPLGLQEFKEAIKPEATPAPGKTTHPIAAAFGLIGSLPSDLSRYLKLRSM